ncbi:MAG: GNAT family N-acetyltransferase [Acidobacteriota bacterium]
MKCPAIELREVTPSDLPVFYEQQLDPEANRMAAFPARDRNAFMKHWSKILEDGSGVVRAVVADGELAGNIVAWGSPGERKVGYWIGRDFWGRGIASAALKEFLQLVDERPLLAHVARRNAASIRVLEKCGFTVQRNQIAGSFAGDDEVEELLMVLDDSQSVP